VIYREGQVVDACFNNLRHSGAMRSIEPGISRFRVWCLRTIPE
jgi:hypothetical protein